MVAAWVLDIVHACVTIMLLALIAVLLVTLHRVVSTMQTMASQSQLLGASVLQLSTVVQNGGPSSVESPRSLFPLVAESPPGSSEGFHFRAKRLRRQSYRLRCKPGVGLLGPSYRHEDPDSDSPTSPNPLPRPMFE